MRRLAVAIIGLVAPTLAACDGPAQHAVLPSGAFAPLRSHGPRPNAIAFTFTTLDDQDDLTFNELLGINNESKISGYYGSGAYGHPNDGYIIYPPYGQTSYRNEEYPGATGTQVTSLNNTHTIAGFYADKHGRIFGFIQYNGLWFNYQYPKARGTGSATELLGINDAGIAVGSYSAASLDGAFELDEATGEYVTIDPGGGATNVVATGIDGVGDVAGYFTSKKGVVVSFLLRKGIYREYSYPGSSDTEARGITLQDRIVGSYVDRSHKTHGFLLTDPLQHGGAWQSIDDPKAAGKTVATSINVHDDIVGYYLDASGNTNGFLATPKAPKR